MGCPFCERTGAYLDGELPAPDRVAHEAHLRVCVECAEELVRLQRLSRFLSAARAIGRGRARVSWQAVRSRRELVRFAEVLTAAAALVMAVCSLWLFRFAASPMTATTPGWERMAMNPQGDSASATEPDDPLAQALLRGQP